MAAKVELAYIQPGFTNSDGINIHFLMQKHVCQGTG